MTHAQHTRWQGYLAVGFGAALPVGEGAVWALLALLVLMLAAAPKRIDIASICQGPKAQVLGALCLYWACGLWAMWSGGHGALRPSELGRQGPWLVLPVILLTMAQLPWRWQARAALGFVVSLCLAAAFGIGCFWLDARPGELLLRPSDLAAHQGFVPGTQHTVAGGFYFHRLKMAHVLLVGIGALCARQLTLVYRWPRRASEAMALALLLACLALTYTRGAFVAAAVGGAASMLSASRRVQLRAFVCGLALVGAALVMPQTQARLQSMLSHQAAGVRGLIWSQATCVVADHPAGLGLANYTPLIGAYYDRIDPGFATRTYPHNLLLAAWAEAGPVGLVAYASIWLQLGFASYRLARRRHARHPPRSRSDGAHRRHKRCVAATGLFLAAALWTLGITHDVLYHAVVAQTWVAALGWCLSAAPDEALRAQQTACA